MSEIPPDELPIAGAELAPSLADRAHLGAIIAELTAFRSEMGTRLTEVHQLATTAASLMEARLDRTEQHVVEIEQQIRDVMRAVAAATKLPRPAARLSKVIAVLYGAVLSYALYALADSLIINGFVKAMNQRWALNVFIDMLVRLLLFIPVLLFLIKHLGDVVMIEARFPARRERRYLYEIVSASFYLATFALLARGSFFALLTFAIVLWASAIWSSELAKEYRGHPCRIAQLARTLRALHYIGCALFLVLIGAIWVFRDRLKYDQLPWSRGVVAIAVLVAFLIWYAFYEHLPRKLHGRFVRRYLLSYVRFTGRILPKAWFGDGRVQ